MHRNSFREFCKAYIQYTGATSAVHLSPYACHSMVWFFSLKFLWLKLVHPIVSHLWIGFLFMMLKPPSSGMVFGIMCDFYVVSV